MSFYGQAVFQVQRIQILFLVVCKNGGRKQEVMRREIKKELQHHELINFHRLVLKAEN